jgi:hypothetical protein
LCTQVYCEQKQQTKCGASEPHMKKPNARLQLRRAISIRAEGK